MKRILVVIDMQNDFIEGSLGTKEAKSIVPNVIDKINNFNGTVIYTRDTHDNNYLETPEGKNLPVEHCIFKTLGWEIPNDILVPGLKKHQSHYLKPIYNKPTFGCEDLSYDLRNLYTNQPDDLEIELIGLCTDVCVISNALLLKAYMPAVKISVDASCCAGVTQNTHEAALKTMQMCQINVYNKY